MAVELKVQFPGGKRVDVAVGDFIIPTDQLAADGGTATAPPPFFLFLGSIAACAGFYALRFCQSRNLAIDGLDLSMDWEPDVTGRGPAQALLRLRLPQDFPDRYRDGIIRAIGTCAVKKHIETAPDFRIEIDA